MVSRQVFMYVGHDLVAEHTTAGDASSDVVVGRVWVQDPGTGETVGQVNLHSNTDSVSGVSEWSQAQVDAVFYALVADLAGAPQELIDTERGSVAGCVTQSLFGRRQWLGVVSPVLFAGQYEDDESGWVYNRFRFYDPAGGVYGAQDPLGVGPNVGTPQGYVHNPLTWVDTLGLESYPKDDKALSYDEESGRWVDSRTKQPTKDRPYENPLIHESDESKPVGIKVTPNSVHTYINHDAQQAIQNSIYDKNGDLVGHVDFKNHNPANDLTNPRATSGHGHIFPPGQPMLGHGKGAIHIPNKSLPAGWDALPEGISPRVPIGE